MNRSSKTAKFALLVMVVSLAAGCETGTSASVTAPRSPSYEAASPASPSPSAGGSTEVLSDTSDGAIGITVTVPAPGWTVGHWGMEWGPDGFDPPGGAGIIAFVGVDKKFYVYGDPCDWKRTRPDAPATTVDELVAALAGQASRSPSAPKDITVGGYSGQKITLHVADDARVGRCDEGTYTTFGVGGEKTALYAQGPGEIGEIWIVDVDGRIVLLEGGYYAGTPQHAVDELHAILRSVTFG